jgi:hypothetical protein
MQWWDPAEHMVWNPPGSFDAEAPPQSLHLVPNTAWCAYAFLAADDIAEGTAALRSLLALQYDRPGRAWDGTFRRFLEMPEPPDDAVMWVHYDPNWRQFVGTTFALIVEDYADRLEPVLVDALVASIGRACAGEPDGRIAPSYTNPALMRAWLDAWYGARAGDAHYCKRGLAFAERITAEFDEFGAFEEFNSPTYYGIDLYALRLWQEFAPDPFFAREGARLESALWSSAALFFNANLQNFCGPYTRSYGADARTSVSLFSIWLWAILGREFAPLPDLDAPRVDHGHDLMAGPVFARLAPSSVPDAFRRFGDTRAVHQALPRHRTVTAWIAPNLMLGAESSDVDWGGWSQFMPATAHWGSGVQMAALRLVDPHVVHARASERRLDIALPNATHASFELRSDDAIAWSADGFATCGWRVEAPGVAVDGTRLIVPLSDGAVSLRFTDAAS